MASPIQRGETYRLTVLGTPVGQGRLSANPVMRKNEHGQFVPVLGKGGRPVTNTRHSNAKILKPWRNEVAGMAAQDWGALGLGALDEPFAVQLCFYFKRPLGHFGTGRNSEVMKDSAALYPVTSGSDIDHLERAVLDALSGIVWKDDKQVVSMRSRCRYGLPERCEIAVRRMRVVTMGDLRALRREQPELADALAEQLQLQLVAA